MIIRVLEGTVDEHRAGAFTDYVRREALPRLRAEPGLVYVKFGRQADSVHGYRFVLFTEWETTTDLYRWLKGRPIADPVAVEERRDWLTTHRVEHYEALDRDLEEPPDTG
jgi:hypothetical protein